MAPNTRHVHTFQGEHFSAAVYLNSPTDGYHILLIGSKRSDAQILKHTIQCSADQLKDLERVCKLAHLLITHLSDGGSFEIWHSNFRNN